MAIINLANEWVCLTFIIWLNDEVTYIIFNWLFFYCGGWRERDIKSWQLQTPTDSQTWLNNNSHKDNTDTTLMLLSPEGKYDQVWLLQPCKSGQSDTCGGADTLLPEMFLCFNESWYQPQQNASSPANLALSYKTNIKVGAGGGTAAKLLHWPD